MPPAAKCSPRGQGGFPADPLRNLGAPLLIAEMSRRDKNYGPTGKRLCAVDCTISYLNASSLVRGMSEAYSAH
jgi:hypothetical protein